MNTKLSTTNSTFDFGERALGIKAYDLVDHLRNVATQVSDRKAGTLATNDIQTNVLSYQQYYPFGWNQPGRSLNADRSRFTFNGKEFDPEWNIQDYGFRLYDNRLGKFLSFDPLSDKYPDLTPYQFASNTPIQSIDLDGLERFDVQFNREDGDAHLSLVDATGPLRFFIHGNGLYISEDSKRGIALRKAWNTLSDIHGITTARINGYDIIAQSVPSNTVARDPRSIFYPSDPKVRDNVLKPVGTPNGEFGEGIIGLKIKSIPDGSMFKQLDPLNPDELEIEEPEPDLYIIEITREQYIDENFTMVLTPKVLHGPTPADKRNYKKSIKTAKNMAKTPNRVIKINGTPKQQKQFRKDLIKAGVDPKKIRNDLPSNKTNSSFGIQVGEVKTRIIETTRKLNK